MATVFIPSLLRGFTQGAQRIDVPGANVREVIDGLDAQYPGIKARLVEDNRLRRGIAVVVDGTSSREGLRHALGPSSEVHFVPAIAGGTARITSGCPFVLRASTCAPRPGEP